MFGKKRYFIVTLVLNGTHPYRTEPHFQYFDGRTKELNVYVLARNWNDAEKQALNSKNIPPCWSWYVKSIRRGIK